MPINDNSLHSSSDEELAAMLAKKWKIPRSEAVVLLRNWDGGHVE